MSGEERKPSPFGLGTELFDPDAALEGVRARERSRSEPTAPEADEALRADSSPESLGLGSGVTPSEPMAGDDPDDDALPVPALADADADERSQVSLAEPVSDVSDVPVLPSALLEPEGDAEAADTMGPVPGVAPDEAGSRFETAGDPRIPEGQHTFRIGEVAQIVGVRPYVLRYWETEFPSIEPRKTDTGQRRYDRDLVAQLLKIKRLRHEAQLTVAQTKAVLADGAPSDAVAVGVEKVLQADAASKSRVASHLAELREQVLELLALVED